MQPSTDWQRPSAHLCESVHNYAHVDNAIYALIHTFINKLCMIYFFMIRHLST
ncbi:hypothetical protein URH17368_0761 [Alicyclobacillus hesperidum URH17-3-68]|nr:hypothetical protein URH17368_0761 [Alicyclobacillus hesperidum URH17-3-68]